MVLCLGVFCTVCIPYICPRTSVLDVISDTMLCSRKSKIPSTAVNLHLLDNRRTPCDLNEEVYSRGDWHVLLPYF